MAGRIINTVESLRCQVGRPLAAAALALAALALFVHVLVPVLFGPHMLRPRLADLEIATHCSAGATSHDPQRSWPKPQNCPICRHVASATLAFVPALIATEPTAVAIDCVLPALVRQVDLDIRSGSARPRAPPIG